MIRRQLIVVTALCFTVQFVSATWFVQRFETPNVSTQIARNILEKGLYEGESWVRFKGPKGGDIDLTQGRPRMAQLPGEALFLAFWLRFLPESAHRYIHVPVTVVCVAVVAYIASFLGGTTLGLLTGIFATFQPFVVIHGAVWDDTFLSAALVWMVVALLFYKLQFFESKPVASFLSETVRISVLACASALASITRVDSQLILLLLAGTTFAVPGMRRFRLEGVVIVASITFALGAWGLRNMAILGRFTVTSTHDGITLWESNGPFTKQALWYGQVEAMSYRPETMGVHWARTAGMTETEVNSYYRGEAIKYMVGHPFQTVSTSLLKVGISLLGIRPEMPVFSSRNMIAISVNLLMLLMAALWLYLAGISVIRFHNAAYWIFALFGSSVILILAVGPIGWRYRIMVDGILWMTSSSVILWAAREIITRLRRNINVGLQEL